MHYLIPHVLCTLDSFKLYQLPNAEKRQRRARKLLRDRNKPLHSLFEDHKTPLTFYKLTTGLITLLRAYKDTIAG